ncbi:MAG: hypothetical protein AAGJ18_30750, partial [Bacteroidota bacterium]
MTIILYFRAMLQRIGLHILFWVAIVYWRSSGDYLTKFPFELYVKRNLLRLPFMIMATYMVIYYLLPQFIFDKKEHLKFGLFTGLTLYVATQLDQWLMSSDLMSHFLQLTSWK